MLHKSILYALKEYIDLHPDTSEFYFKKSKNEFLETKIYLTRIHDHWDFIQLNALQRFMHKTLLILSFGYYELYGTLDLNRLKPYIKRESYDRSFSDKVIRIYENLLTKIFGGSEDLIDEDTQSSVEESQSSVEESTQSYDHMSQIELLKHSITEKNHENIKLIQRIIISAARTNPFELFGKLDEMSDDERISLVRILSLDLKCTEALWNGIMTHGKAFQLSTRLEVARWLPSIIRTLTLDQIKASSNNFKFWAVVDDFIKEFSSSLSIEQWECIVNNNPNNELLGKLMINFPVDGLLYDKLKIACGKIPIDFGKEFTMVTLLSNLKRYQERHNDHRSLDDLKKAINKAPKKQQLLQKAKTEPRFKVQLQTAPIYRTQSLVEVHKVTRPSQSKWVGELFDQALNNPKIIDTSEEASSFFWAWIEKLPLSNEGDNQEKFKICLSYLIRHYPNSVFDNIDEFKADELSYFLKTLETTKASYIVHVWDSIIKSAKELSFTDQQFARNKAQRILNHVSPQLIAGAVSSDKLWAVLRYYPDLAGQVFSKSHIELLAESMMDTEVLAKMVTHIPHDKDLGEKLKMICIYMVPCPVLELSMNVKISWYSQNVDEKEATELSQIIKDRIVDKRPVIANTR